MDEKRKVVALAGNPNVGKSTIFNGLTGLRQHTGNWAGVTVTAAAGILETEGESYLIVDLPGIYSLDVQSGEEEIARDFLCSGLAQTTIVICDATCLERGLYLLKQILSLDHVKDTGMPVILCVNLWDEARRKGIDIDISLLQDVLQIPVIPICARSRKDLNALKQAIRSTDGERFSYDCLDFSPKQLAGEAVTYPERSFRKQEEFLDRLTTGPVTGILIMLLLLLGIFWISMAGANYPSALLWNLLFAGEEKLAALHFPGRLSRVSELPGIRSLPGSRLGRIRHAPAHGHFLSSFYPAGRSGIPAPGRLQYGSGISKMQSLRKTVSDHGHGSGLQRRRRHRLPDH